MTRNKNHWPLVIFNFNNFLEIFYYDIFTDTPDRLAEVGIKLHYLATWWDVLAACKELGRFDTSTLDSVEAFLHSPRDWSKEHGGI